MCEDLEEMEDYFNCDIEECGPCCPNYFECCVSDNIEEFIDSFNGFEK